VQKAALNLARQAATKNELEMRSRFNHEAHEEHEVRKTFFKIRYPFRYPIFVSFATSCENTRGGGSGSVLVRLLDSVIPAWSAGIQADMDVSGRILRTWMPAIHAGMTKI
jgi:hypothetical protein